jgi:ribosomal-protein-alanine N-acetyltransferase
MLPIHTERLLLRPFLPVDAVGFAAYRSDPEVARYQSWTTPYPVAKAERFVGQMASRLLLPPRAGEWNQIAIQIGTTHPDASSLIGDCVFRLHSDDIRQASIGISLATAYQRRGFATEALRALLGALFDGMNLHRVTAVCDTENSPSQRALERAGMRREAHYRQNVFFKGSWGSEYAYAMLQAEWHEQRRGGLRPAR